MPARWACRLPDSDVGSGGPQARPKRIVAHAVRITDGPNAVPTAARTPAGEKLASSHAGPCGLRRMPPAISDGCPAIAGRTGDGALGGQRPRVKGGQSQAASAVGGKPCPQRRTGRGALPPGPFACSVEVDQAVWPVEDGSTLMPVPIDELTATLSRYLPLAPVGLALTTASSNASKLARKASFSKLALPRMP